MKLTEERIKVIMKQWSVWGNVEYPEDVIDATKQALQEQREAIADVMDEWAKNHGDGCCKEAVKSFAMEIRSK